MHDVMPHGPPKPPCTVMNADCTPAGIVHVWGAPVNPKVAVPHVPDCRQGAGVGAAPTPELRCVAVTVLRAASALRSGAAALTDAAERR